MEMLEISHSCVVSLCKKRIFNISPSRHTVGLCFSLYIISVLDGVMHVSECVQHFGQNGCLYLTFSVSINIAYVYHKHPINYCKN